MSSPLENLQSDATAKLNSEEYFSTISVVSVRKLQIASEIAQKLPHLTTKGGKTGCGVLVGMPTIDVVDPNAPGPQLMVRLPFRVQENPTINLGATGTGKSAEEVAMQILRTLHPLAIEGVTILFGDKGAITPNTEFPGLVTYDVFLAGRFSQDGLSKVQTPDISSPAQTVTLTNNTAGASIYYTTDDSFPGAGNPAAQPYGAPFDVEAGTIIRWAAYKTGMIGSDVGRATIT
jgi:hypothetical protein